MADRQRPDFAGLARALLADADNLVPAWLPGGKRVGREWVCADLSGGEGHSCSVNLETGAWGDFQAGEAGKDLISLYAAIHGMTQGEAYRELSGASGQPGQAPAPAQSQPRPAPKAPPAPATRPPSDEGWRTQRPVPPHAPAPTFRHQHRQPQDIEHRAEYRTGDELHGWVIRFRTSGGGKDPLPHTWCLSARDGAAKWHWRQWDEPRPLYLAGHALPAGRTVILVEGERKADDLQALLDAHAPGVYCVASWPGGCKAWRKADWSWLAGCTVVCWPDCDAQHVPLTAAERKAAPDKVAQAVLLQGKPLLPADQQPGMAAMMGIGGWLRAQHGCTVQMLPIPEPGTVPSGWDCGDAIRHDGWDFARVMSFLAGAYALPDAAADASGASRATAGPPDEPPAGGADDPPAGAGPHTAGSGDADAFQEHLDFMCASLKCNPWDLGVNRKLLIAALQKAPALAGCLGYNELTSAPGTLQPWPWRDRAGLLAESDDLRLGDWLSSTYRLKAASRAALAEAMDTVADMRRYHPIRDWLQAQVWDGKHRSTRWLMHVLAMDPATVTARRAEYLGLMGRFMLLGLVARVMDPGCKFDYSPVFEGRPGVGKSTLVLELVGKEFFSDTHFDIGNGKDGMEQLEGLWAYELSELTAFKRADSEQIKQFFSSTVDRFRGAYGKFVQPHPRQCVIFCTTNKRQYLYDTSGNRRFWPVWIDQQIRLEWLRKYRGQLFAEALALWRAGERIMPTPDEERRLFKPEQDLRLVETTVQSKLYDLLTREGAPATEGRATAGFNVHTQFIALHDLVQALGADAAKSTSLLETQIRGWLDAQGWTATRESTGQRRRGYARPEVWPPEVGDEEPRPGGSDAPAGGQPPDTESQPARADDAVGISDDDPF